ncbi:Tetratricopeptide repeat protein 14 [Trichinella britovi]|uniref:Tetratricopeptide repeat protein 14 n=1 Tax=Trichinella britovi TaxID=45882 RepID=A0A0V1CQ89_TRIBR|nr:Tetratricopeptide repeat protein 14 [Trichinella britovi]
MDDRRRCLKNLKETTKETSTKSVLYKKRIRQKHGHPAHDIHYPITAPLDTFFTFSKEVRLTYIFEVIKVGDFVYGEVVGLNDFQMIIRLLCLDDNGPQCTFDSLNLTTTKQFSEVAEEMCCSENSIANVFKINSYVRAVIFSIDCNLKSISLSMRQMETSCKRSLGHVERFDLPIYYQLAQQNETFQHSLTRNRCFENPVAVNLIFDKFKINMYEPHSLSKELIKWVHEGVWKMLDTGRRYGTDNEFRDDVCLNMLKKLKPSSKRMLFDMMHKDNKTDLCKKIRRMILLRNFAENRRIDQKGKSNKRCSMDEKGELSPSLLELLRHRLLKSTGVCLPKFRSRSSQTSSESVSSLSSSDFSTETESESDSSSESSSYSNEHKCPVEPIKRPTRSRNDCWSSSPSTSMSVSSASTDPCSSSEKITNCKVEPQNKKMKIAPTTSTSSVFPVQCKSSTFSMQAELDEMENFLSQLKKNNSDHFRNAIIVTTENANSNAMNNNAIDMITISNLITCLSRFSKFYMEMNIWINIFLRNQACNEKTASCLSCRETSVAKIIRMIKFCADIYLLPTDEPN